MPKIETGEKGHGPIHFKEESGQEQTNHGPVLLKGGKRPAKKEHGPNVWGAGAKSRQDCPNFFGGVLTMYCVSSDRSTSCAKDKNCLLVHHSILVFSTNSQLAFNGDSLQKTTCGRLQKTTFSGGRVPKTTFSGGKLPKTTFSGGRLTNTTFSGGRPPKNAFSGGRLPKTTFSGGSHPKTTFNGGSPQSAKSRKVRKLRRVEHTCEK